MLIVTSEAPPVISGISKTVELLEAGLTARGNSVDIISRADFPAFIRNEVRLSAFAFFWRQIARQIRHYDVINVHGPVPTMSEVFLLFMRLFLRGSRPAVVYTHHCDIAIPRLGLACGIYNFLANRISHNADRIVVSTSAYQGKMITAGKTPVDLVPWGVEVAAGPEQRSEDGDLKVLFVGQLREYKGVNVLLDAVSGEPGISVTLVGDGPLREQITERIAAGGLNQVHPVGRLSDAELAAAYRTHDVIVLPSTTTAEAYGLVLAEGMLGGCVPVASDLPGVREVASTGIVVPPSDHLALRAAFRRLAHSRAELNELRERSLLRATDFRVSTMARRYEDSFRIAVYAAQAKHRVNALPMQWDDPERLFADLRAMLGQTVHTISLTSVDPRRHTSRVWTPASHGVRTHAPLAHYVASTGAPLLLSNPDEVPDDLRPMLANEGVGSAVMIPIATRGGRTSVLSVSTPTDDGPQLNEEYLDRIIRLLQGEPERTPVAA